MLKCFCSMACIILIVSTAEAHMKVITDAVIAGLRLV